MTDKLSRILVKKGKITSQQAEEAEKMQATTGGSLVQLLVKLRYVKEDELAEFIANQHGLPLRKLHELVMSPEVSSLLDLALIEKYTVLPIAKKGNTLELAVHDPMDYDAVEELRFLTGMDIELSVAARKNITTAIDHYFRDIPCKEIEKAEKGEKPRPKGGMVFSGGREKLAQVLAGLLIEKGVLNKEELLRALQATKSTPTSKQEGGKS